MKNIKNVVKGLVICCIVMVGCLVAGVNAKAQDVIQDSNIISHYTDNNGNVITTYKDGSYYINSDVEIQSIDKINNTVTINRDGQLYSFYVDNTNDYYLGEMINITMDNTDEVLDCVVDSKPIIYDNVKII